MGQIKQAIDALDKATPGPWKYCGCNHCHLVWGNHLLVHDEPNGGQEVPTPENEEGINNAKIIAAAPDMAAWIKEAAPWLERIKEGMESPLMCEPKKYDAIDALLARVKDDAQEAKHI